jgi:hypothetical protein
MSTINPMVANTGDSPKTGVIAILKKHQTKIIGVVVVIVLLCVMYYAIYGTEGYAGYASPDGSITRKGRSQTRSDANFDKTWNLKELEHSVALLNRNS